MSYDDISDLSSELSSAPPSPELRPSSPYPTPAPSQSDERDDSTAHPFEDMPPARKRRKVEVIERKTRQLQLHTALDNDAEDDEALDLMLRALRKRRKIVVVVGAGISVSAGIPDFRSSQGLFRTLKDEHKLKASGKQLFDASVYKHDSSTESFHDMLRSLSELSAQAKPTLFHRLLARISKEDRLLRLYTQNVDGLESTLPPLATQIPLNHKAPWPRTIQLHGGLEQMVCHKCKQLSNFDPELFKGPVPPECPECRERDSVRTNHAGKRSHGIGRLRPRIVLYNEANPDEDAIGAVVASDLRARPDAVIVVGTTLKIPPVRRIVKEMCLTARGRQNGITMMINKEKLTLGKELEDCFDVLVEGESDEVARLANLKDWDDDSEDVVEDCSASDVERAKAMQRNISVVIETPKKQKNTSVLLNGIMTPPISIDEEVDCGSKDSNPSLPEKKQVKNPASIGRSLADVLGQGNKENQQKKTKTKSMVKMASKSQSTGSKKTQQSKKVTQTKIISRVSKASKNVAVVVKKESSSQEPSKPLKDVPPSAHRNNATQPMFPGLANLSRRTSTDSISSIGSTICATPSGQDSKIQPQRDTVSPTGNVPVDMKQLLNY